MIYTTAEEMSVARVACPGSAFAVANAFTAPLSDNSRYEAGIVTEFLEHINEKLRVIARNRPATKFTGTIANDSYVSHVRHSAAASTVAERCAPRFDEFTVDPIVCEAQGHVMIQLEGIKRQVSDTGRYPN